jgi:hypothetical protein
MLGESSSVWHQAARVCVLPAHQCCFVVFVSASFQSSRLAFSLARPGRTDVHDAAKASF